jgi:hypothetical protein
MSLRAKGQVVCLTSAEKLLLYKSCILLLIRITQTISLACNSHGIKRGLLEGALPGTAVSCHASGWMHTDIWLGGWNTLCGVWRSQENIAFSCRWVYIFTHTKSIVTKGNACENGTVKLYFPSHSGHKTWRGVHTTPRRILNRDTKAWFWSDPERMVP